MSWEVIVDYENVIGENPLWHEGERALYWCSRDDEDGYLYRYDPGTGEAEQVLETGYIGGLTLHEDGSLLLFRAAGKVTRWDGETEHPFLTCDPAADPDAQFNDVIADPEGRVFCGTMYDGERTGSLYRIDLDGTCTVVVEDVGISNGLGFAPGLETLYYTDSDPGAPTVSAFAYDRATGAIADRRTVVAASPGRAGGVPDGLTVDTDGCILSAQAYGWCLLRYRPDGTEIGRYDLPVSLVTSLTFGGDQYDQLFVTSGRGDQKQEYGGLSGALFRLDTDLEGRGEFRSRLSP